MIASLNNTQKYCSSYEAFRKFVVTNFLFYWLQKWFGNKRYSIQCLVVNDKFYTWSRCESYWRMFEVLITYHHRRLTLLEIIKYISNTEDKTIEIHDLQQEGYRVWQKNTQEVFNVYILEKTRWFSWVISACEIH